MSRTAGGLRLQVDSPRCHGMGLCQATAPHLFRLNDDGVAETAADEVTDADDVALARSVAQCCPMAAIELKTDTDDDQRGPL